MTPRIEVSSHGLATEHVFISCSAARARVIVSRPPGRAHVFVPYSASCLHVQQSESFVYSSTEPHEHPVRVLPRVLPRARPCETLAVAQMVTPFPAHTTALTVALHVFPLDAVMVSVSPTRAVPSAVAPQVPFRSFVGRAFIMLGHPVAWVSSRLLAAEHVFISCSAARARVSVLVPTRWRFSFTLRGWDSKGRVSSRVTLARTQ